jgi:hypothetical protein
MTMISGIEKILPVVEKFSPAVATALGMPYAGIVINALCHLFGVQTSDALPEAMSGDALAQVKMKQIESQIASIQSQQAIQLSQIQDRQDARAQEIKKNEKQKDWIVHYLSVWMTVMLTVYITSFEVGYVPYDKDILGHLFTMTAIIFMFYF